MKEAQKGHFQTVDGYMHALALLVLAIAACQCTAQHAPAGVSALFAGLRGDKDRQVAVLEKAVAADPGGEFVPLSYYV